MTIDLADNHDVRTFGGQATRLKRLAMVTPVLDDWDSFVRLIENIASQHLPSVEWIEVVAVDDGSADVFDLEAVSLPSGGCVRDIRIIHLALNLGHQRAIATGLVTLAERNDLDAVIVMDSDGEDPPEEIPSLVRALQASSGQVILARRRRRTESVMFRTGYHLYRFFFRVLTGRAISFGNFSILPIDAVRRLIHMPELWNNLPAAIIRSRLPFVTVDTVRGRRYSGASKMDFAHLIIHGLSAMSVYTDLIFVRVLLMAAAISVLAFVAIIVVVGVRLATSLAIPGWATTIFGDLVIILCQAVFTIIAITLLELAGRSARPTIPKSDARTFIRAVSESFSGRHRLKQPAKPP